MANTTNYSWETPDDTDLVKDGAAAIRTLGTAIDTTVFNNAGAAIAKTIVDAKGDIIAATAADTVARLAVGANDTVLTADSSTATGLKWASAASSSANYSLLNAGGTSLSGTTTTVSGISGMSKLYILISEASSANAVSELRIRLNTDSGSNYQFAAVRLDANSSYSSSVIIKEEASSIAQIPIALTSSNANSNISGYLMIDGANSTGTKTVQYAASASPNTGTGQSAYFGGGLYKGTSTISSVSFISSTGNFDSGTVYVYGSAV